MSKFAIGCIAAAVLAFPGLAMATVKTYSFNLDGSQQVPANPSSAVGSAQIMVDDVADTISFAVVAFNLGSAFTASHIHAAPAGSNGGVVFDLAANSDSMGPVTIGPVVVPASWSLAGVGKAAGGTLADDINAKPWNYYVNLHTALNPSGEIRGQLAPVPEGGTLAMMVAGLGVVGMLTKRRRAD